MSVPQLEVGPNDIQNKKNCICFCQTILPVLILTRSLGLCPLIVKHQEGLCVFQKSLFWSFHTFGITCSFLYDAIFNVDYKELIKPRSMIMILEDINNAFYTIYVVIASSFVMMKASKLARTLNRFSKAFRYGVYCSSARTIALKTQYGIVGTVLAIVLIQTSIYIWLYVTRSEITHFTIRHYYLKLCQNLTFGIYALFCSIISVLLGVLVCFEKLTMNSLKYIPVHPMEGVDESSNSRDFLGVIHFKLCKNDHPRPIIWTHKPDREIIDELRIAHEAICLCIYDFNDCNNPLLLIHTVVELTLLIVHWYATVAYIVYTFEHPATSTVHIFNCLFVFLHTWGMYVFLRNACCMRNMVLGLSHFLLEYSTRTFNLEDHQQVRYFVEKLKRHRPFTASGLFCVDLGIAGPIAANILTYVLVALQFELPEQ